MSPTITIRTNHELRSELEKRAAALGQSLSETVRDILTEAVAEKPFGDRVAGLKGRLRLDRRAHEPWRQTLGRRNRRE